MPFGWSMHFVPGCYPFTIRERKQPASFTFLSSDCLYTGLGVESRKAVLTDISLALAVIPEHRSCNSRPRSPSPLWLRQAWGTPIVG